MTAIFPSDDRIRDIVYQCVQQLHESSSTGGVEKTSFDTNSTNIYERILIDLCAQCFAELPNIISNPNDVDQFRHEPLAFYNPPNRLECIQQHVLQKVQKLLRNGGANTIINGKSTSNAYIIHPSSAASRLVSSKRKRDLVDEILVQEMLEGDALWTNFDVERVEVLRSVTNDILRLMVKEAIDDCQQTFAEKLPLVGDNTE